jgi:Arc/MetJ family transcription regulator
MAIRKTALLIDDELVAQVRAVLGTTTTTETITEAMREVLRIQGRARHLERLRRREGLDLDDVDPVPGGGRGRARADAPR